MPAFAFPSRLESAPSRAGDSLHEARESLAYWEDRARRLPRRAIRRRREARELAARWQARVIEAEYDRYGRGVLGALLVLGLEGRLPEPARRAGRRIARRARQAAALTAVALVGMGIAATIALVALVSAVVGALT